MGLLRYLPTCAVMLGCGRINFEGVAIEVPLVPLYPTAGANWNDYVARDWATPDELSSPDVPCPELDDHFYDDCIHGGEKRLVIVDDLTSCEGVAFADQLGAFDWRCASDGTQARFYSLGLKPTAGLAALVEADRWKPNRFEVRRDGDLELLYATRLDEAWWSNPVVPLPDNPTGPYETLTSPGTIYTLAASRPSNGYYINADGIALVTLGDAVLTFGDGPINCDTNAGSIDVLAAPSHRCLVFSGSTPDTDNRLWLEGRFERADVGIYLAFSRYSVLRRVRAGFHTYDGIALLFTSGIYSQNIAAYNNGRDGFHDHYSYFHIERDVVTANNVRRGTYVYDGGPWRITNVTSFNNGEHGVFFSFNAIGSFVNILSANNGGDGVYWTLVDYDNAVMHGVTSINNTMSGLRLSNVFQASISHVLLANNGANGVSSTFNNRETDYAQIVIAHHPGWAVGIDQLNDARFATNFMIGDNAMGGCNILSGTNPGLDASCQSTARLTANIDLRASFVGAEPSVSNVDAIDWSVAPGQHRIWGANSGALDATALGPCTSTCRTWNFALAPGDTVLRDAAGADLPANAAFVPGAACPAAVDGDRVMTNDRALAECDDFATWRGSCDRTYLIDAREIIHDHIGNDDGLCQSNEHCIYTPHLGADQGSGQLGAPCIFRDGRVTGVKMFAYASP